MSKKNKKKKKKQQEEAKREEARRDEAKKEEKKPEAERNANVRAILTWSITITVAFAVLVGLSAFAILGYGRLYENRIFPGVRMLDVRLDGLTTDEARATVHEAIDASLKDGLRFRYDGRDITLAATTVAPNDPDVSRDLVRYDIEESIMAALTYGRSGSVIRDTLLRWKARVKPASLNVNIFVDEEGIRGAIVQATEDQITTVQNATLDVTWNEEVGPAETSITESSDGEELQLEIALAELHEQSETLNFKPIELKSTSVQPSITKSDIEPLIDDVSTWIDYAPFTLTYEGREYVVSKKRFATWIGAVEQETDIVLSINPEFFKEDVRLLAAIEQMAEKGSLVIEDDKVVSFAAGTTGYAIQDEETLNVILDGLGSEEEFPIVVKRVEAALSGQDPERLGIREIIGIGRSNFAGSPRNRRHNIALGVERVDGSLIAPGEEFSLLKTLGDITAANGWLAELVIKGNTTVPEYGGGLCQIGTTTFRAALQAGMEITERRNHSYRVSYYEPAGTDATIYEPSPDFRFRNNMEHHVLIHAYIVGSEVVYEFWGTDDGREVTVGKPSIYNITSPPPTKLIETTDLPPGKKKCTESAHAGADAALDYKVEYADGSVHEETFYSHYRAWQAVCLVGVEALSDETSDEGGDGDGEGDAEPTDGDTDEEPVDEEPPAEEPVE
jgi:vancomycin resistance protein YoaR